MLIIKEKSVLDMFKTVFSDAKRCANRSRNKIVLQFWFVPLQWTKPSNQCHLKSLRHFIESYVPFWNRKKKGGGKEEGGTEKEKSFLYLFKENTRQCSISYLWEHDYGQKVWYMVLQHRKIFWGILQTLKILCSGVDKHSIIWEADSLFLSGSVMTYF